MIRGIKISEVDKFKKHQLEIATEQIIKQAKEIVRINVREALEDKVNISEIEKELDQIKDEELKIEGYKLLTSIMGKKIFSLQQDKK